MIIEPHTPIHHAVNVAAIAVPTMSWLTNSQPMLTAVLTVMGILWYAILYVEKWRNRK